MPSTRIATSALFLLTACIQWEAPAAPKAKAVPAEPPPAAAAPEAASAAPAPAHAAAPAHAPAGHGAAKHAHWAYEGAEGAPAWGSLSDEYATCGTGTTQSPVDLGGALTKTSPIEFHYRATPATVVDNGHTLQVNLAAGSSITVEGHTYELVQFHFHTPSEHTIAGDRYPLEVHLVHKDAAGKLAVVGVMYDVGETGEVLEPVWRQWPCNTGAEVRMMAPFDPSRLLPEERPVFRYAGSLTTPPCSEGVSWFVMRRSRSMTASQLTQFRTHYPMNARPVQPLNAREIR